MKRMSEVFELPVTVPQTSDDILFDFADRHIGEFTSRNYAQHAAHAINNCDALADVIENVLHHHGNNLSYEIKSWCVDALNTYRGTK